MNYRFRLFKILLIHGTDDYSFHRNACARRKTCYIFDGPEIEILGILGRLLTSSGVIFSHFGAQLRKANDLLRVCEPLRILLLLAAQKCSSLLSSVPWSILFMILH